MQPPSLACGLACYKAHAVPECTIQCPSYARTRIGPRQLLIRELTRQLRASDTEFIDRSALSMRA